ncbi:MAG TPA: S41 family peptidase [Pirellulales bacterium]|nr:S41 family peptidase [Pirellulales bacterium]
MPRRNLYLLLAIAFVSLVCYQKAESSYRSRYGRMTDTIVRVMQQIDENYVEEVDDRKLFEGALNGIVSQLNDPYSAYEPPQQAAEFRQHLDQKFGGIGIQVSLDEQSKRLTVLSPMIGTPAYETGILAGDTILEIDGQDTAGFNTDDALRLLRGDPGEAVRLKVLHAGEKVPVEIELTRAVINVPSVLGDTRDAEGRWRFVLQSHPEIGYVRITTFGDQTLGEMEQALERLSQRHVKALILDLRGNAGGFLKTAVATCDLFVREGQIVSTRGRRKRPDRSNFLAADKAGDRYTQREDFQASGKARYTQWPMVVLVDHQTASASEIVSACLQDHGLAVVVGERTWGKGTVQNVIPLENGKSQLKLTVATYWRPSGKNIHRLHDAKETDDWGVRPDPGFEVKLTPEQLRRIVEERHQRDVIKPQNGKPAGAKAVELHPTAERDPPAADPYDPQLDKAVEYLNTKLAEPKVAAGSVN